MSHQSPKSEMDGLTPAEADEKFASAAFAADPYPYYEFVRSTDPVRFVEPMNAWFLTRFSDIKTALEDDRFVVAFDRYQENRTGPRVSEHDYFRVGRDFLVNNDPPRHTAFRRVFQKPFSSRRVQALKANVELEAHRAIDDMLEMSNPDLVEHYTKRVPLSVIAEILDIPESDHEVVYHWAHAFHHILAVNALTPAELEEADEGAREALAYFSSLVAERRKTPGEDFISVVVAANADSEDPMTDDEIASNFFLLYFAGFDTQKFNFTNVVSTLDLHPDARRHLAEDTSRVSQALPEVMRWDPVSHFMGRTVSEKIEIGGKTISPGETVMLGFGAATRDPSIFPDPNVLDLTRKEAIEAERHLLFGYGRHHCVGSPLAKMNIEIMLRVLLDRIPEVSVDWPNAQRRMAVALRGFDVLPIVVNP